MAWCAIGCGSRLWVESNEPSRAAKLISAERASTVPKSPACWPGKFPTRLIDISRTGCLLESRQRVDDGTVGELQLQVQRETSWTTSA